MVINYDIGYEKKLRAQKNIVRWTFFVMVRRKDVSEMKVDVRHIMESELIFFILTVKFFL